MKSLLDLQLNSNDLSQIEGLVKEIKEVDLNNIKSEAVRNYVDKSADPRHTELFTTKCYTLAVVSFLNYKGYKLTKTENDSGGK